MKGFQGPSLPVGRQGVEDSSENLESKSRYPEPYSKSKNGKTYSPCCVLIRSLTL
jgi:hypothetical protein